MKKLIAKYILYVYLNFIKDDDIEIFKEWVKPFIRFLWYIRSSVIWLMSILFFPFYLIGIGMTIENIVKDNKK